MRDLHLKEMLAFLYSLILFSNTLEDHEEPLLRVLNHLKEFGLILSTENYTYIFKKSVNYLGHIVSEKGVETDPKKVATLKP